MKFISLGISSLVWVTSATWAQEHSDKDSIEVIQVQAQKRVQNINDVAITLSVIDGEEIERQNLKDTTALSGQVSNFKITQNTAEGTPPAVNIRGVGSIDYNTSTTSPVGVYVDNVAGGSSNTQLVNLYDIAAIEVLKGPQGTLFGRNTTAGAILIQTRRPDWEWGGYVNVGVGQQNLRKIQGALNMPINDTVATRLAVNHQDYDYSVNNLHPGAPEAGMKQSSGRFSVLAEKDNWSWFSKVYVDKWDGIVQPPGSIGVVQTPASAGQPEVLCPPHMLGSASCTNRFGFRVNSNNFYDVEVNNEVHNNSPHTTDSWGADTQFEYHFNDDTYLTSITSYSSLKRNHLFNSDASPARIAEGGQDLDTEIVTQELRLHHQWNDIYFIGGVYYLKEDLVQDNFIDLFRLFRASPDLFKAAAMFDYDNRIDTRSFAAFTHVEYPLGANTTLSVGLRYTDEKIDYRAKGKVNAATAVNDQTGVTVPTWDVSGDVKDDNLSGKIALNHKWSRDLNTYISYARGFKSGGYNGAIITTPAEAERNDYGSETLNAYEVGGRLFWDQQNAYLQFSVFNYDYKDQQVFMNQAAVSPNAPPIQLLDNIGKSRIYGAELDLQWQLTSRLKTRFGVGYMPKAELKEFVNARGEVIRHNRLPYTSRWNINGFVDYVIPVDTAEWIFQLNMDYQSEFYFDQNQNPYTRQAGYTLVNGSVSYEREDWAVALWVKNLTNREYSNNKFDLIGLVGALQDFKGEKRQFGVDLKYRF